MAKFISSFGDKLLSRALRTETAGACVPEHGQPCGGYCSGGWWWECSGSYYSCTGSCVCTSSWRHVGAC
jgi:hypothetical protein